MALHWSVEKVADMDTVCFRTVSGERQLSPLTNVLIWATVSVGLGAITAKNVCAFYRRLALVEALHGTFLNHVSDHGVSAKPISKAEVEAHIGLTTNVSDESEAKWLKRQWQHFRPEYSALARLVPQPEPQAAHAEAVA